MGENKTKQRSTLEASQAWGSSQLPLHGYCHVMLKGLNKPQVGFQASDASSSSGFCAPGDSNMFELPTAQRCMMNRANSTNSPFSVRNGDIFLQEPKTSQQAAHHFMPKGMNCSGGELLYPELAAATDAPAWGAPNDANSANSRSASASKMTSFSPFGSGALQSPQMPTSFSPLLKGLLSPVSMGQEMDINDLPAFMLDDDFPLMDAPSKSGAQLDEQGAANNMQSRKSSGGDSWLAGMQIMTSEGLLDDTNMDQPAPNTGNPSSDMQGMNDLDGLFLPELDNFTNAMDPAVQEQTLADLALNFDDDDIVLENFPQLHKCLDDNGTFGARPVNNAPLLLNRQGFSAPPRWLDKIAEEVNEERRGVDPPMVSQPNAPLALDRSQSAFPGLQSVGFGQQRNQSSFSAAALSLSAFGVGNHQMGSMRKPQLSQSAFATMASKPRQPLPSVQEAVAVSSPITLPFTPFSAMSQLPGPAAASKSLDVPKQKSFSPFAAANAQTRSITAPPSMVQELLGMFHQGAVPIKEEPGMLNNAIGLKKRSASVHFNLPSPDVSDERESGSSTHADDPMSLGIVGRGAKLQMQRVQSGPAILEGGHVLWTDVMATWEQDFKHALAKDGSTFEERMRPYQVLGGWQQYTEAAFGDTSRKKGNGGRQPAADPRIDPAIDPKKAERIIANRQSAARSKARQRDHQEALRRRHNFLKFRYEACIKEISYLKTACEQLSSQNELLSLKIQNAQREQQQV